jgi:hypothetical protein
MIATVASITIAILGERTDAALGDARMILLNVQRPTALEDKGHHYWCLFSLNKEDG